MQVLEANPRKPLLDLIGSHYRLAGFDAQSFYRVKNRVHRLKVLLLTLGTYCSLFYIQNLANDACMF